MRPASYTEGRFAIVTNVESGMQWTRWCRSASAQTNDTDVDAKARGPGLPTLRSSCVVTSRATMGAKKPGSQGERAISVKTIVQGMPGGSGWTCGSFPVLFSLHGGHGRGRRPAFPAPSDFRG